MVREDTAAPGRSAGPEKRNWRPLAGPAPSRTVILRAVAESTPAEVRVLPTVETPWQEWILRRRAG